MCYSPSSFGVCSHFRRVTSRVFNRPLSRRSLIRVFLFFHQMFTRYDLSRLSLSVTADITKLWLHGYLFFDFGRIVL